jgi:hypothetical protein
LGLLERMDRRNQAVADHFRARPRGGYEAVPIRQVRSSPVGARARGGCGLHSDDACRDVVRMGRGRRGDCDHGVRRRCRFMAAGTPPVDQGRCRSVDRRDRRHHTADRRGWCIAFVASAPRRTAHRTVLGDVKRRRAGDRGRSGSALSPMFEGCRRRAFGTPETARHSSPAPRPALAGGCVRRAPSRRYIYGASFLAFKRGVRVRC